MCGDLSRENCHYSIQESVVIVAHGRETWVEQGGMERGGTSMTKPWKRAQEFSQWLSMEGKRISCGKGVGRGLWVSTSTMIRT